MKIQIVLFISFALQLHSAIGFYIRKTDEQANSKQMAKPQKDDWSVFQEKLGLTKHKVELLKSQKDQQGTKELLHRYISENPKYLTKPAEAAAEPEHDIHFLKLYQALLKKLKMSKSMLKTSLNFELADKPLKNQKRSRRKIAVKMVSDMPSERIDDLLKMFNEKHGLNQPAYKSDDDDDNLDLEYGEADMPVPPVMDPDYMYDNLYDDVGDADLMTKSRQNSDFGSFQDLFMRAQRDQWERENEESKLQVPSNEHFF